MYYSKHAISDIKGGDVEVFVSQHIDRTNVYFAGLTGKGGRVLHLMNGSRFFCGRKYSHSPYILHDHDYTVGELSSEVRGVKRCERCFGGMKKVNITEGGPPSVKMDIVKLGQMHFKIISEAIANSILLTTNVFDGITDGMAIASPAKHDKARHIAEKLVVESFNLSKKDAGSFPLNDAFSFVYREMPETVFDLFGVASAMMRHGQIVLIRPKDKNDPYLMMIANSSTIYYTACRAEVSRETTNNYGEQYNVTPLPYTEIDYNKY